MPEKLTDQEILAQLGQFDESEEPDDTFVVAGSSGTEYTVLTTEEAAWFESALDKYQEQYSFDNIADLQDLDRLLSMELLSYRYSVWIIRESDYDGNAYDDKVVRDSKDKIDKNIISVKAHLGIGRKNRVESEQQSTADYITTLLQRAGEFGVHRDAQNAKIMNLFMDLKSLIGLHDRSDDEERTHNHVHVDDIIDWIRTVAIPEFQKLDDDFRENQKYWIKDL
jgi:hypothetical protein